MAEWDHNICEKDWFQSQYGIITEGPNAGAFRLPNVMTYAPGSHNVCCMCGSPTVSGIFIRANENDLLCKGDHDNPNQWSPIIGAELDL